MISGLAFGGYAAAALLFSAMILWRSRRGVRLPAQRLLLAGFADRMLGLAQCDRPVTLAGLAETFRNLLWLGLLHSLSGGRHAVERQRGVRLVYGAVAAVLGLEVLLELMPLLTDAEPTLAATATLLRMTAAAGLLVLVHNLYGQADAPSRSAIGMAMLALVATWGYDLNLFTLIYLIRRHRAACSIGAAWSPRLPRHSSRSARSMPTAGAFACRAMPPSSRSRCSPSVPISRSWRSWLARWVGIDWARPMLAAVIALMVVAAMIFVRSPRARAWAR